MKRFALVFAALALTGAMAYADDAAMAPAVKITTEVNTGFIISNNSTNTTTTPYAIDYGPGSGDLGPVVGVNFAVTGSNFGYSIEPVIKGSNSNQFNLDHAWAYVMPMDAVTVYGGADGNNAPFNDLDDNGSNSYSTTSIGAFYSANGLSVGAQINPVNGTPMDAIWLAVHYGMDKVFALNAYGTNSNTASLDQIRVTASLLAVPNLTLTGGFNGSTMATSSTASNFIDATAAYAVTDAFTVGATVYALNLSGNTLGATVATQTTQAYYTYKPYVTYAVNPMVTLLAYYDGETAPYSGATLDSQILGQVQWMPAAGVTIKFSAWYDTNAATSTFLHSNYVGDADTSQASSQTNFAIDTKFAF